MSTNALSGEQFGGFFAQPKSHEPEVLGQGKARAAEAEWGKPDQPTEGWRPYGG